MSLVAASVPTVIFRVIVTVVIAVVATLFSLRLLGSRRGWVTALFAGVLGWGAATAIALGVNDWDWGADGLVIHLLAIGIPATMAAAVILDLLARPGSLALGERAGLVVTPRPMRAVRKRISVIKRYHELVRLCRQEGFGPMTPSSEQLEHVDDVGVRVRRLLEQAGGVYIKLGQIAATRVDIIPAEICDELATLQNRVEPVSRERIAPVLESELGRHRRRGVRRVRLGAARSSVDRSDVPRPTALRRERRRQGAAARHRRADGPRPRRARPARRPRPAADTVRPRCPIR